MCSQDHPEHGVLYLVRGLLNMVQDYTWEDNSDAKVRVYVSALPLLAAMGQETYIYSIPKGTCPTMLCLEVPLSGIFYVWLLTSGACLTSL